MIVWSGRIEGAVEAFAKAVGVQAQKSSDGSFGFSLSQSGALSFTPGEESGNLIISLARRNLGPETEELSRLLWRAGWDGGAGRHLHCGATDDGTLVHAFELGEWEVDISAIQFLVQRLIDIQEK